MAPPQFQEAAELTKIIRRANTTKYLEYLGMVKLERKLTRKILEDPGLKPPAPPPSSRETSYGVREVTTENLLAAAGELKDRQDKLSRATAALIVAMKEAGEGPWEAGSGLREGALLRLLGEQVARMEDLKESLDQKRRELAMNTPKTHRITPQGPIGVEACKSCSRHKQMIPREEDRSSRRPVPHQQEKANRRTAQDRAGQEGPRPGH